MVFDNFLHNKCIEEQRVWFPGVRVVERCLACARPCEAERERRFVLVLCCAFSAVLSASGHTLPCEAWRDIACHEVIVTNPPPQTQPSFFHPQLPSLFHVHPAYVFSL